MLLSARPLREMGAPSVPAQQPRYFPQWSRTAVLTLSSGHDDELPGVKKSPPDPNGPGFVIGGDPAARVSHLEHSVRFLQEQHRLMLSGLHGEIEALRERNRDLQFQLIFKQESAIKSTSSSPNEENSENSEEAKLKREVTRLEREASSARSEARAAEARALQLQRLVDAQAEKLRELDIKPKCPTCVEGAAGSGSDSEEGTAESRAALRARLADAERLVRRLRAEAERRRREVLAAAGAGAGAAAGGAVTNLLFDGAAARHAHVRHAPHAAAAASTGRIRDPTLFSLQCMKNSLHASLRATGLDGYGFQNNYHFPPVHTPEFWREPIRDEYGAGARGRGGARRPPLTLPELGHPVNRATVYANNHTRPRANGYENKTSKRPPAANGDLTNGKSSEEPQDSRLSPNYHLPNVLGTAACVPTYPELQIVVTKIIPHGNVHGQSVEASVRARARRPHRKHAPDHT